MKTALVDGAEFFVKGGIVHEVGTGLRYDPETGRGFQIDNKGRRIALTSYAAFGNDMSNARHNADIWRRKAAKAWEVLGDSR